MIPIALVKKVTVKSSLRALKSITCKSNKLRNVNTVRSRTVNVSIISYVKIKVIVLIINLDETNLFEINKYKSKNGDSVSEELALFNCILGG